MAESRKVVIIADHQQKSKVAKLKSIPSKPPNAAHLSQLTPRTEIHKQWVLILNNQIKISSRQVNWFQIEINQMLGQNQPWYWVTMKNKSLVIDAQMDTGKFKS